MMYVWIADTESYLKEMSCQSLKRYQLGTEKTIAVTVDIQATMQEDMTGFIACVAAVLI